MEASALHAPSKLARRTLPAPLLRLRSDEQLVALFRAGSDEAFATLHDRYRQRLFAYVRQMLSTSTRGDAEDVLQDVFVRAYGALRNDRREVNVRAWLYRVAHNRCIDQLRRPVPPAVDVFETSRTPPLQDPMEAAQRREDLRRLVADVGRLPDQQRSALLMREIDGLAYVDIADALDVTVPAVKSLLVRARVGLVEAIEARDADCGSIRRELLGAYDRGVKAPARARKHLRECSDCREYRGALKGMKRSFAALTPAAGVGPLALVAKALGLGGAGASAGGVAGGAAGVSAGAAACKVAAVVCTAALATGGAMEARQLVRDDAGPARSAAAAPGAAAATTAHAATVSVPSPAVVQRRTAVSAPVVAAPTAAERRAARREAHERALDRSLSTGISAPDATPSPVLTTPATTAPATTKAGASTGEGGSQAPDDASPVVVKETAGTAQPTTTTQTPAATAAPVTSTPAVPSTGTGSVPTPAPTPAGPAPEH